VIPAAEQKNLAKLAIMISRAYQLEGFGRLGFKLRPEL
jgi:hypothetical protein